MGFYSWPSAGSLWGYNKDEETVQASVIYAVEFIKAFIEKSGSSKVHILAHSMGNRLMLRVMEKLADMKLERKPVGQIIMAAPDVHRMILKQGVPHLHSAAERTTLYISPNDKAISLSGFLHGEARLGYYPPPTVVEGLDTVLVGK